MTHLPIPDQRAVQHIEDDRKHERTTLCGLPWPAYPLGPVHTCAVCADLWRQRRRQATSEPESGIVHLGADEAAEDDAHRRGCRKEPCFHAAHRYVQAISEGRVFIDGVPYLLYQPRKEG